MHATLPLLEAGGGALSFASNPIKFPFLDLGERWDRWNFERHAKDLLLARPDPLSFHHRLHKSRNSTILISSTFRQASSLVTASVAPDSTAVATMIASGVRNP